MKIKKLIPTIAGKLESIRINKQIKQIEQMSAEQRVLCARNQRYVQNQPVMLSEKAQSVVDSVNDLRNKEMQYLHLDLSDADTAPFILGLKLKNGDTVEISRTKETSPHLHFLFFDKNGEKREQIKIATRDEVYKDIPDFLRQCWDCAKGQVHDYKSYRNNVMRVTDGLNRSRWRTMSFEEIVNARPVVLKRINSLLENLGESLGNR